jgi:DNA-binding NarL/FixJ family response regulator
MERAVALWLDESNVIFRRGMVETLVSSGFVIIGESVHLSPAPDLDTAEVLVLELDGPGLMTATKLAADGATRIVGIAESSSTGLMGEAVKAGFAGLLIREEITPASLVAAVRAVACGIGSIPPAVLAPLLTGLETSSGTLVERSVLAGRELNVLRLLAEGGTTREIAGQLCYSERTVKNIVHDTLAKLHCRTRAHAVAVMARQGAL